MTMLLHQANQMLPAANPVAQALKGAEFVFMPVYTCGDNKITTWLCFTNADYYKSEYQGQNVVENNTRSYISSAAEKAGVTYLSKCTYFGKDLTSVISPYNLGNDWH